MLRGVLNLVTGLGCSCVFTTALRKFLNCKGFISFLAVAFLLHPFPILIRRLRGFIGFFGGLVVAIGVFLSLKWVCCDVRRGVSLLIAEVLIVYQKV